MSGTPEFKKSLGEFFKQQGDLSIRLPEAQHQAEQLRKDGKKHVGFFGLCWGTVATLPTS